MVLITRFAILAFLTAQCVLAAPWKEPRCWTTHSVRSIGPTGSQFKSYHPKPIFESYGVDGIVHPLAKRDISGTNEEAAKAFLEEKFGIEVQELSHKSGHSSTNVANEYFKQVINNITVANAVANVALKGQKVVSFGASFVKPKRVAAATPELTEEDAISKAEDAIGGKYNTLPTSVEYFAKDSGDVVLTRVVQVQNDDTDEWYEVFVDANSGEIVNVISFVAHAKYRVIPFALQNPNDGFQVLSDPQDPITSPDGWHRYRLNFSNTTVITNATSGNNAHVYKSSVAEGLTGQNSAPDVNVYEHTFDPSKEPSGNKDAASVNVFYLANMIHDLLYHYGFIESSYNFQYYNYGKGGSGNDPVYISVQDGGKTNFNNANFATPPDGANAGEVWANIGHEIYAALVAKSGLSTDKKSVSSTAGNVVALHLLIDALATQPCNPTFISARDAIIQADANRYGSANKCTLWNAFAKRGLGLGATMTKVDSKTLPSGC
ncbi:Extracellular metalloproteinase 10 [Rhizoctonia solani AG-1 IB]|uniref:Extracellular metalloproteinase n=1 Tax=Thanatephorus cucumeris (strain AG1-IB / isolate 7/3/14) TaxID=1108050 RepID=M5CE93_THACB|nr:Extracellular metalloproteinase 10 [Rhizoctonia solani AG-1 IB]